MHVLWKSTLIVVTVIIDDIYCFLTILYHSLMTQFWYIVTNRKYRIKCYNVSLNSNNTQMSVSFCLPINCYNNALRNFHIMEYNTFLYIILVIYLMRLRFRNNVSRIDLNKKIPFIVASRQVYLFHTDLPVSYVYVSCYTLVRE